MAILVIDDEPGVLRLECLSLERAGFKVIAAMTRIEAIHLFQAHKPEIDLAVIDVSLGSDNGLEIAADLKSLQPGLRTLFVSGQSGADIAPHCGPGEERMHLLEKPFLPADLVKAVKEQLATLAFEYSRTAPDGLSCGYENRPE